MNSQLQHLYNTIDLEVGNDMNWNGILSAILEFFDCTAGSIHTLDRTNNTLHLKAHQGIPDFLLPKMAIIPVGKGMAGVAAERLEAVQMCNLQTDDTGIARPSAKETKVEGAMTAPMLYQEKLYGTLGIAKSTAYDFTEEETIALLEIGAYLVKKAEDQFSMAKA